MSCNPNDLSFIIRISMVKGETRFSTVIFWSYMCAKEMPVHTYNTNTTTIINTVFKKIKDLPIVCVHVKYRNSRHQAIHFFPVNSEMTQIRQSLLSVLCVYLKCSYSIYDIHLLDDPKLIHKSMRFDFLNMLTIKKHYYGKFFSY